MVASARSIPTVICFESPQDRDPQEHDSLSPDPLQKSVPKYLDGRRTAILATRRPAIARRRWQ